MPRPYMLQIVQYEGDEGFYLFYLNKEGREMTDTYHDEITRAFDQAGWEFGMKKEEWTNLS